MSQTETYQLSIEFNFSFIPRPNLAIITIGRLFVKIV
jgi:hypothetical protein